MGTILASTLITKVQRLLHDDSGVRWSDTELLEYLNDGQKEVCLIKPDAYTLTTPFVLAAGSKQSIPNSAIQLMKIIRNMGTTGTTPGRAISLITMSLLDNVNPTWHTAAATAAAVHWMFEELNPKVFWVYPANTGTGWVEAILGTTPPDVATTAMAITLDDIYQNALVSYMLHKSMSKDADFAANQELSQLYYQSFMNSLLTKEAREKSEKPQP